MPTARRIMSRVAMVLSDEFDFFRFAAGGFSFVLRRVGPWAVSTSLQKWDGPASTPGARSVQFSKL
jgi:hypothetical protein